MPIRRRAESGVVLPTSVMFLSIVAVAAAALAFVLTMQPHSQPDKVIPVAEPTVSIAPAVTPSARPKPKPALKKGQTFVEVYNNSNIRGLAGKVAKRAGDAGWNVVGSDNWYGTVSASTVYAPPRLQRAARALAKDLGVARVKPAVAPMKFDRLTVVLTGDYRG